MPVEVDAVQSSATFPKEVDVAVIGAGIIGVCTAYGLGPGSGLLASQLATGETPCVDPTPYRLSRFSDGSAIRRPDMM